jgi:hypothetical protein
MIDAVDVGIDVVALVVSLALAFYVRSLLQIFRGGMMDKAFRAFEVSTVFLVASLLDEAADSMGFGANPSGAVSAALLLLFTLALFYGFYLLHKSWAVKLPPKPAAAASRAPAPADEPSK